MKPLPSPADYLTAAYTVQRNSTMTGIRTSTRPRLFIVLPSIRGSVPIGACRVTGGFGMLSASPWPLRSLHHPNRWLPQ